MLVSGLLLHITINISAVNELFTDLFVVFLISILTFFAFGCGNIVDFNPIFLQNKYFLRLSALIFTYVAEQSLKINIC
jgi:hypothetical protein